MFKYYMFTTIDVSSNINNQSFGKKDKHIKMFLEHPEIDEKYYETDLVNKLKVDNYGGICDGYCHHHSCKHFLLEGKSSSHISKAISQLKNTASQLVSQGKKIDKAIIFCDKIPRYERRLYRQGKNKELCKNFGNLHQQQIFLLGKIEIYIHYKKDITQMGVSCLFG